MGSVSDMMKRTLGGQKTTIGSARVLFFNCKNQSEKTQWYTGRLFFASDGCTSY